MPPKKKAKKKSTEKPVRKELTGKSERREKGKRRTVAVSVSMEGYQVLYQKAFDLDRTISWVADKLFLKLKQKGFVL